MAITKIKGIKVTVEKAIKYIMNPKKTDGKLLVTGFQVVPAFAAYEFNATAELAKEVNGDFTKTGLANNLAYHMIQSFSKKDLITSDQAHEVGKRLANEFLQGKHEYVLCTHIDKGHIHNHIIFNSVSYIDHKKFRSVPYKTVAKIREINDRLCSEFNLDVIAEPIGQGVGHKEWQEKERGTSWKVHIRKEIDDALRTSTDFSSFLKKMKGKNIEIKEGVHLAFRLEGQERFVRGKTIGERYTKEGIQRTINANAERRLHPQERVRQSKVIRYEKNRRIAMPVATRVQYEVRRKQVKETKELANMLLMVRREHIIQMPDFDVREKELRQKCIGIRENKKQLDAKKAQYQDVSKKLILYSRHLPLHQKYDGLQKTGKVAFHKEYGGELMAFTDARVQLEKYGVSVTVDPGKIIQLIQHQTEQIVVLKEQIQQLELRGKNIRKARQVFNGLIGYPTVSGNRNTYEPDR